MTESTTTLASIPAALIESYKESQRAAESLRVKAQRIQIQGENAEKQLAELEEECQRRFSVTIAELPGYINSIVPKIEAAMVEYIKVVAQAQADLDALDAEIAKLNSPAAA